MTSTTLTEREAQAIYAADFRTVQDYLGAQRFGADYLANPDQRISAETSAVLAFAEFAISRGQ